MRGGSRPRRGTSGGKSNILVVMLSTLVGACGYVDNLLMRLWITIDPRRWYTLNTLNTLVDNECWQRRAWQPCYSAGSLRTRRHVPTYLDDKNKGDNMIELHDAHSSHYDDGLRQNRPLDSSNAYLRAITLNKNQIYYPSRVRVITPCSASHDAIEARELALWWSIYSYVCCFMALWPENKIS